MIPVTCAVEGITDEPIARRLLAEAGLSVGPFVRKYGGKSRIDRRLPDWNASAARLPWIVIRDLDRDDRDVCIPALRSRLLGNSGAQSGMCFRFAVRSVEAWAVSTGGCDSSAMMAVRPVSIRPVEEFSMAQRLSFEERARVDAMTTVGVSVAEAARRLGRHRSTICRELDRGRGPGGYGAESAQAAAAVRGARPRVPKLVADPDLAAEVADCLKDRWSPQAVSAQLRAEGPLICAETIYRACYDPSASSGLPEGSWRWLR